MNSTLSKTLIFATGVVIGAVAAQQYFKTKYEQIAREEIEEVRAYYSGRLATPKNEDDVPVKEEVVEQDATDPELKKLVDKLNELKYTEDKEVHKVKQPYVISPDEFGEIDEYDTETLFLYADDVLTDDQNEPIEDVDDVVGFESLRHFGEYEEDSVHVRNDNLKTDYEILRELRKYEDVINTSPHQAEVE